MKITYKTKTVVKHYTESPPLTKWDKVLLAGNLICLAGCFLAIAWGSTTYLTYLGFGLFWAWVYSDACEGKY